jgi:hypothetical protein
MDKDTWKHRVQAIRELASDAQNEAELSNQALTDKLRRAASISEIAKQCRRLADCIESNILQERSPEGKSQSL